MSRPHSSVSEKSDEQRRKKTNKQNKHQKREAFTTMEGKKYGHGDRLEKLAKHSGQHRNKHRGNVDPTCSNAKSDNTLKNMIQSHKKKDKQQEQ